MFDATNIPLSNICVNGKMRKGGRQMKIGYNVPIRSENKNGFGIEGYITLENVDVNQSDVVGEAIRKFLSDLKKIDGFQSPESE
jgi:hypothetical protein